ncbi:MAG: hypothetical protein HC820_05100 [Hydrococcus sp. RM1_1_31]|nr:hypothetical protein [Hydrococcus sp. RM1_1_31]
MKKDRQYLIKWQKIVNRDLGMPVGEGDELRVTTPLWEASFSLTTSDNYRQTFLQQTALVQHASFGANN